MAAKAWCCWTLPNSRITFEDIGCIIDGVFERATVLLGIDKRSFEHLDVVSVWIAWFGHTRMGLRRHKRSISVFLLCFRTARHYNVVAIQEVNRMNREPRSNQHL